jgi:hypothetical protein
MGEYKIKLAMTSGYNTSLRNTFFIQDEANKIVSVLKLNGNVLVEQPDYHFLDRISSQLASSRFAYTS